MPSSKSRKRRAQQRRGASAQTGSRRPPRIVQPTRPAQVEDAELSLPVEGPEVGAEAGFENPVDEQPEPASLDTLEADEADEVDEDEAGADETLEEQEEDVEEAVAALATEESAPGGRRGRQGTATVVAERTRPVARSANRNRRRGAVPQPQGPAVVRFFRETFDELRKVDWPTPTELYRYTIIVIVTVIVLAAFISGIDWALQHLAERFVYGSSVAPTG